jgi:hypothetical protein
MSQNPPPSFPNDWLFYLLGATFLLLGIAFFLVPLLARSGAMSNVKIPSIILYVYNKDGFYFATSPILIIISAISLLIFLLRR